MKKPAKYERIKTVLAMVRKTLELAICEVDKAWDYLERCEEKEK